MKNFLRATDFLFGHGTGSHEVSSLFSLGSLGAQISSAGVPGQASASAAVGQQASAPRAQNSDDDVKPIDPKAEIARIDSNIALYHAGLAIAAVGISIAMCMFVRTILKPPKGVHGGDSDEDMDSDEEDDESEE